MLKSLNFELVASLKEDAIENGDIVLLDLCNKAYQGNARACTILSKAYEELEAWVEGEYNANV